MHTDTAHSFRTIKAQAMAIEGMTLEFSLAVMDSLLSFQTTQKVTRHLIEFGVYKGRSAAILANQCKDEERLLLVDVADYPERETLRGICDRAEFVTSSSEDFPIKFSDCNVIQRHCRFVHIDSSHRFRATLQEIALAESLLCDGGIIALDDFINLNYSQILAATYKYLFMTDTELCIFLITDAKAYLCKKQDFEKFGRFVLDKLLLEMTERDIGNLCLARTDADDEYRPIYLREKYSSETDSFYGLELYAHYYQTP
jgi:hypothetical protein